MDEKEKISIIIPVYNEEKTIAKIIMKLIKTKFPIEREIIIVNDGSTDSTEKILKETIRQIKVREKIRVISRKNNKGKGHSIKTGLKYATGSIIGIQDADLEYDPNDYPGLLEPILKKQAKVVYGVRRFNKKNLFYYGNKFLSLVTSLLYFSWIRDMETGYKVFRREVLNEIKLNSKGFDFEPEVTAKILKKYKIKEIPISYTPRSKKEGKKIKIKDGIIAFFTLIKYRFAN